MKRAFQKQGERPDLEANPLYFDGDGTATRVIPLVPYERRGRREAIMAIQGGRPMIYAARVEDGLIKVGCSTDIYRRMAQLHGDLLGFRFGDMDEEREIHASLAAHVHHGREWYYPTLEVIAFVNELRQSFGLEPIAA